MYAKDINWRGSTLDDLITFPQAIRRIAGFELHKVQHGKEPTDWKPINEWGMGVIEIRLHGEDGEYRVVYVARFSDVVCVLHCFQKKTQKTSQRDIAIIKARYKAARDEWRQKK
ncbi:MULTISPECIES: type II toxin-antitoxin system RelE/ParE family toxin [Phytobacter]|uniref:Phage-related protein n=1 Tax=Phytobacter diazotrophicus TaxID=395631 RepID=A0ABM7VST0_9ENTR|nr:MULTISPECIES: type II toxin-antitoxin system RelE/ParE family toxin [Phytobacter]MDU4150874.1 type II toxin-antitoxin system RelE/ParE family toxin [Enterobacteriaceae bacterium]MDU7380545.1 type II toxin-antitoxin system RelE/ParE family toxin [Enterobacteriaceae bacterium]BBE76690.1 hypothetical protein MRY16398_17460 [Phytobacter sp. MRY16-398]BDD50157.1 hypothetical protein PDTA9734_16440 [Phytobacter diazotrophicus]BEG81187.1 type II toxin-antitoxin system RelE/ParE family toxin [Phyto